MNACCLRLALLVVIMAIASAEPQFAIAASVVPYAAGDALRLLAVSSAQRVPQFPGVPTMIESGYPGFTVLNWTGLMAPAGTPKQIVDRIAAEVARMVKDPHTAALLSANGVDPVGRSPQEFAAMIAADIPLRREAVSIAGIAPR